jgi:hypothetical protein
MQDHSARRSGQRFAFGVLDPEEALDGSWL